MKNTLFRTFCFFSLELLGVIPINCIQRNSKGQTNQTVSPVYIPNAPVEKIEYVTDTITQSGSTLMLYCKGQITRYYMENQNKYRMQMPYFAHENWHYHNDLLGYKQDGRLTPMEFTRLCMWDEISANMCAILTARYEYLCADDKESVLKKYEHTYMSFYFRAIKSGYIKPSMSSMSGQERSVLVNGTRNMWMKTFWPIYSKRIEKKCMIHIKKYGLKPKGSSDYLNMLEQMLTIGGVDFYKKLQVDVFPKSEQTDILDYMSNTDFFKYDYESIANTICDNGESLRKMNIHDRCETLKQIIISCKLKNVLHDVPSSEIIKNRQTVKRIYDNIVFHTNNSKCVESCLRKFVNYYSYFGKTTVDKDAIIHNLYDYNDVSLSELLDTTKTNRYTFINHYYDANDKNLFNMYRMHIQPKVKTTKNSAHCSEPLYLNLPNFSQPILENATDAQIQEIQKTIRDFDNIPEVFKNCNVKAQQEYIKKQKTR